MRRVLVTTNNNTTTLDCTHLSADDHLIVIPSRRRRWTRITFYCMLPINLQKHRLRTGGGGQEQGIASNWIASQDECALEPHSENDAARPTYTRKEWGRRQRAIVEDEKKTVDTLCCTKLHANSPVVSMCTLRYYGRLLDRRNADETKNAVIGIWGSLSRSVQWTRRSSSRSSQPSKKSSIEKRFMHAIYIVPYIY